MPAAASTGATAICAALNAAAKADGGTRRCTWSPVAAPSRVMSSHSIRRGSSPSMSMWNGSPRRPSRPSLSARNRGESLIPPGPRSESRSVGRMPDGHRARAGRGGGAGHVGEPRGEVVAQRLHRAARQRDGRRVDLQVEPVELEVDVPVARGGPDVGVHGRGLRRRVHQADLELRADRRRPLPEAGAHEHPAQRREALAASLGEPVVVARREALALDLLTHAHHPARPERR